MEPYAFAVTVGEASGVRLEVAGGIPTWEAFPAYRHQRLAFNIQSSIRPTAKHIGDCACVQVGNVYIRFPDGSLKRPDISIFCREPGEETTAITMLPEAVIEILSPDYEAKDLSIGVPFYLRSGIKDILVLDPDAGVVRHFRPGFSEARHTSPVTLTLACGCDVTL